MKPSKSSVRIPVAEQKNAMKRYALKWKHFMVLSICSTLLFLSPMHAQTVSTIIGNGTPGYSGNGGPATAAEIDNPCAIAVLSNGDLLISDLNCIRKVNTSGTISLFAGTTVSGYSGDGGPATAAEFRGPSSIALDASGNIYFVDPVNNVVRKINTSGVITTIAGNGIAGYIGDNGPATAAELNNPAYVTVDASGNLLISDYWNFVIRKVNTSGTITTIAGTGTDGFSGMGGPATAAEIGGSWGIVTDASGNIFFTDPNNDRIMKIDASGTITSIAGNGVIGAYSGDGGPATAAGFWTPNGIALDKCGNIYFTDAPHGNIRKIDLSGIITTVAGLSTDGYNGDGYAPIATQFSAPEYIVFDSSGNNLLVPDNQNYRYRKVPVQITSAAPQNSGPICNGGTATLYATSPSATAWSWIGPGGFTSTLQNPTVSPSATSTYTLTVSGATCSSITVYTTTVTVNSGPPTASPSNNGPMCSGGTVTLSANSAGATAWSWSGPGGFTSTLQNPSASPSATGTYSLTVSASGCSPSLLYTTTVTVNTTMPTASPTNNGPICPGSIVTLFANSTGATAWSWSGPGGSTTGPNPSFYFAGVYSLTISASGCTPSVYTTTVTANAGPIASPSNNGPVCAGGTATLSANSTGATAWSWSGPGGFTSTSQNPTVSPSATGTYSLTVTGPGCSSATVYTTTVTINAGPTASPSNNGPVCAGGTVNLSANSTGATAWSWSGPGGFTSALQNPTASPSATGTYSLTVSASGCSPSPVYTTTVTINAGPAASPSNNGPICVGGTVNLSANSTGATAWSWSGPGAFASTLQNPTDAPSATGTYSLTVSGAGCSSATVYTTTVTVNAAPTASPSNDGPVCPGGTVNLSANSTGVTAWSWSGPGAFASTLQNPTDAPSATGTFSLTVSASGSGCSSSTVYTTTVTVNDVPDVSSFSISASDACLGSDAIVTISSSSLSSVSYTVGFDLSGSNSATGLTTSATMSSSNGTFNVPAVDLTSTGNTTVTVNTITDATTGCSSTLPGGNTTSFTVNPLPNAYVIGPAIPHSPVGSPVTLSGSDVGVSYQLYDHSLTSGSPLPGIGSPLNFGPQGNGTYTIVAKDNTTGCTNTMAGIAIIGTGHKPSAPAVSTSTQSTGKVAVIPNPNKGDFTIKGELKTTNNQAVTVEITDLLGQVVYSNNFTALNGNINERITLENLVNGMYILNLHSGGDSNVFHIVIEQ